MISTLMRLTHGKPLAFGAVTIAALGALGSVAGSSAFSDTAASEGNHFDTGTVRIDSNSPVSRALQLANAGPGDITTKCITVQYTGTRAAHVHLYSTTATTGKDLAPYLTTTITRGSFPGQPPADNDCTGFTPDPSNSALYSGKLSALGPTYDTGLVDPDTWQQGDTAVVQVSVSVDDDNAAQGANADNALVWEARDN
jgi:hypothetical protein